MILRHLILTDHEQDATVTLPQSCLKGNPKVFVSLLLCSVDGYILVGPSIVLYEVYQNIIILTP